MAFGQPRHRAWAGGNRISKEALQMKTTLPTSCELHYCTSRDISHCEQMFSAGSFFIDFC